ncbi:MAG: tetratricopeptide repeat protein [Cyclobacteriaceae bacterium]
MRKLTKYLPTRNILFVCLFLGIWVGMGSCSSEKTTLVSKAFHNTTAHYNAVFYSQQRLMEIEKAVEESHEDNYNRILRVFPTVDTTTISGLQPQIEDCIKKAALAIQFHQNSKWVDDSYVLIGKAKFYNRDFEEAITTFKYVNSKSEDDDARHKALISLMRTFIDHSEINNAIAASDYLKREELSKENQLELYLNNAHLFQVRDDLDNMVKNLVMAAPMMKPAQGSAKVYFIIGQIYQTLGFDGEAYSNYKKVLKNNPDYELSFYTRLYMAQVVELNKSNDVKKIRKFYKKMLRDTKNKEFKDKIYYEMAEFELKQEQLEQAIKYYKASIRSSINNQRQKAYAYLKLGQINYEVLKQYEVASAYYDSTISVLPKDEENYDQIKERQEVLTDFVAQLTTIKVQDSLLNLAQMDTLALSALLDTVIMKEEEARQKAIEAAEEEKRQERRSKRPLDNPFATNQDPGSGSNWYFYNLSSLSSGQSEFARKWGNRPLEDNWRRSDKSQSAPVEVPDESAALSDSATAEAPIEDPEVIRTARKMELYQTIPFAEEQRIEADSLVELAHYNLGNIYNFKLLEKANAVQTFETLIRRYANSEHIPEALYLLYLIYTELGDPKAEKYKHDLLNNHANSTFAKTLLNPNYKQESDSLREYLQQEYKVAYELYQQNHFDSARAILAHNLRIAPDTDFSDNLRLLEIIITGTTEGLHNYRFGLEQFIEKNPDSDVKQYAQKLLQSSHDLPLKMAKLKGAKYNQNLNQEHLYVLVYDRKQPGDSLSIRMNAYQSLKHPNAGYETANLILDDDRAMILLQYFANKRSAFKFYQEVIGQNWAEAAALDNFVISKDNFQSFYATKDLEGYKAFFDEFYQE